MEPMFVKVEGDKEGTIRIDSSFKEIGGAKSIEIAIAIIESQIAKVPVPSNKVNEWRELNQKVLDNLEEMSRKAKKMETLSEQEGKIKEKEKQISELKKAISELEAQIQREQEQKQLLEE